ncbi:glycoside hydrolase superfamily [Phialemonium atrogriseum]|uniref:Glycoside hydrolase superfamily n=1 Tax=Phialemonium atrogriseum TaxID=1093897 RepID=A0AAJ0C4D0_9PEZI|nr:glycoside hydrolase superfamily [Phialemonium atrogriseum]KAK1768457.1 glycoside hydrolase superfamily [Phialemonium atrogriseum]
MALLSRFIALLGCILPLVLGQALPLHTSSRWILDADNKRVKLRCVNWAAHMETNVPEGLHKQSIDYLADWIKAQGFNCVRLTYSIDHALNPDLKVSDSFTAAAAAAGVSAAAMQDLYARAVAKNPFLGGAATTTRDVFGAVVDALWARGVMTVLDNHVSRASWCCDLTDGNGWWDTAFGYNDWNSRYFGTADWLAGLAAMAAWAGHYPGVVAMSLRNELREFLLQDLNGRRDWYDLVGRAGAAVHAANPDVLVIVGGVQSATDLTHLRTSKTLDTSRWAGKHVWEFHAYSFTVTFPDPLSSCAASRAEYGLFDGFVLEQGRAFTGPLFLSEFGVGMSGGPGNGLSERDGAYLDCLVGYMADNDAEWAVWALQGSYYVRDGVVDKDEGWGLLDGAWAGWRNSAFPGMLKGMWNVTQGP